MSLSRKISEKRIPIMKRWFQEVLDSFPKQSRGLIGADSDRFSNPMGFTLNDGVAEIIAHVAGDKTLEEIDLPLERLVKLRAVQETRTEGPLEFLFALKKIIRETCGVSPHQEGLDEWFAVEERVDDVIRRCHVIYIRARETILELQVAELKNKTYSLRKLSGEAYF